MAGYFFRATSVSLMVLLGHLVGQGNTRGALGDRIDADELRRSVTKREIGRTGAIALGSGRSAQSARYLRLSAAERDIVDVSMAPPQLARRRESATVPPPPVGGKRTTDAPCRGRPDISASRAHVLERAELVVANGVSKSLP
jgi:hypothetical protein